MINMTAYIDGVQVELALLEIVQDLVAQ